MNRTLAIALLTLAQACGALAADPPATQPTVNATILVVPATGPTVQVRLPAVNGNAANAPPRPPIDAATNELLDQIDAASKTITSFKCDVAYTRIQGIAGDKQLRSGTLVYVATAPAKFAIKFTARFTGPRLERKNDLNEGFIFDGRYLVEWTDNPGDTKKFTRRDVVGPRADPATVNPLTLGSGPFAVPITAKKPQLVSRFDPKLLPPEANDPKDSVHLQLIPIPGQNKYFTKVDLWYDKATHIPVQVRTEDDSDNISIIKLLNPETNVALPKNAIDTTPPSVKGEKGWDESTVEWKDK